MQLCILLTIKADHNSEHRNKIIMYFDACLLLFLNFFVLVILGFVTFIVLAAVSMALIDILKVYPNILKIAKHPRLYSHWVLFLNQLKKN